MTTILVVDDEERIRSFYYRLLASEGYRVEEAENADEANDILKSEPVDLVLLDFRMPGANGGDLCEVIKLFHQRVKVIVASVYPVTEQKKRVPGAEEYYDKSRGISELFSKIKSVLLGPELEP
ncbi:MAG: response regulator [Candidatus Omnitrophica bacterium]|nr:response regulator [Candidatus Omnitrophota bacterium]